jgi:membrane fusion protein (multidrug efflux system)
MSKKTRIITISAIPILLLIIIFVPRWLRSTPDKDATSKPAHNIRSNALPVNGYIAHVSYLSSGIRSVGTLVANEEVDLTSETAGKVVKINFEEGSHVKKDDLLVKINDDDIVAQLERAQYQLQLLSDQLERQRILLEKDAVSRESFDKVQTDYNMIAADISLYKARIEKTEVRASFSGVVGFRYVSDGSFVQPGTKVARLVDNLSLKVEFSIPEKYVPLPLMGSDVTFEVEGFTDIFQANVYAVDSKVDTKTRTIALRARYDNHKELLFPGMFASVTLITSKSSSAIQIPSEAIVPEMSGKSVWVVHDGKAVSTPVETGVRDDLMVEVLSGIHAGDTVITTGLMQLRPNIPVHIQQVN